MHKHSLRRSSMEEECSHALFHMSHSMQCDSHWVQYRCDGGGLMIWYTCTSTSFVENTLCQAGRATDGDVIKEIIMTPCT